MRENLKEKSLLFFMLFLHCFSTFFLFSYVFILGNKRSF